MAGNAKDSKIMEQKDTISHLNTVIENQNGLIMSLRSTVDECNAAIAGLREQVEYLTKKTFWHEKREDQKYRRAVKPV